MEPIFISIVAVFFIPVSFLMMLFGIKAIKEHKINVQILKIIFRISPELSPEQSYKLLYPKEVAEKKLEEFYSGYYKMNEKRVIFLGTVMICFGIVIFLIDVALFFSIFFKH